MDRKTLDLSMSPEIGGAICIQNPSFCVCRGETRITTDNKEDFDVAFLTTNRNQDFSHLEQLLARIKKLDFLSN